MGDRDILLILLMLCIAVFDIGISRPTDEFQELDYSDILNTTAGYDDLTSNATSEEEDILKVLQNMITKNSTNVTEIYQIQDLFNGTDYTVEMNKNNQDLTWSGRPEKELPMAMIIAGPAAILGVILFLCSTYYCHAAQLSREAKTYSIAMYISMDESTDSTTELACPSITSARMQVTSPTVLVPPRSPGLQRENSSRFQRENNDSFSSRRKASTLTLSVPSGGNHKRGSSWSSQASQGSFGMGGPRRNSSFIL